MDPLLLGALVGICTILVLFSGVSVGIGLLIVSAGFLVIFDGMRSLELMPEIFFGNLIASHCSLSRCSLSWAHLLPQPVPVQTFMKLLSVG